MSVPPRQQTKNPTSMRYERVQAILEAEGFMQGKLGPKTVCVENRFSEKVLVSEEAAKVTDALHAEGKDAHKVPKNMVLMTAMRVLHLLPSVNNGNIKPAVSAPVTPTEPAKQAEPRKTKAQTPPKPAPKAAKKPAPEPPKKDTKKPAASKQVQQAEAKSNKKPQPSVPSEPEPEQVPESELPPEQQPLKLPPGFDYSDYPHYSVQSSIYSLLLSALNMAEHYEKYPGMEQRQKEIETAVKSYQNTCDPLKIKA